jgi:hypothetical protein
MRARILTFDPTVPFRSTWDESTMRAIPALSPRASQPLENAAPLRGETVSIGRILWRRGTRPEAHRASGSERKTLPRRTPMLPAVRGGRGGHIGGSLRARAGVLALAALASGCALPRGEPPAVTEIVAAKEPEGGAERLCAWYGDARDGVLYFGESAFWSAERAHGDPLADRLVPGPRRIGRFDLAARRLTAPLDAGPGERPTGVWDVLAHPNGRVYFTTWFDSMGWVDMRTGAVHQLDALGARLNEIAPGPGETLLISRYGSDGDEQGPGSILVASLDGERLAEHPLAEPAGYRVAPKTVAFDPTRDEIWVTTDLFPQDGGPIRHDAYVLDLSGREKRRIERPEVQFAAFGADGTGLIAEVDGARLYLRLGTPGAPDRLLLADDGFATGLDFVQDIHFSPDGRAVVTRWSGILHVFEPPDSLARLALPHFEPPGLYYSGVLAGNRVCATHCGGPTVVCAPVVPTRPAPVR